MQKKNMSQLLQQLHVNKLQTEFQFHCKKNLASTKKKALFELVNKFNIKS